MLIEFRQPATTYIRAMAPNPDNFKHVGRHEEYYLNGGDLFLLVGAGPIRRSWTD